MTESDPSAVLGADPVLAPIVTEHGVLRLEPADDFFRRFVVSILRQQVSMAAAEAIEERLFDRVEVAPEAIVESDDRTLRECGLSRSKVDYVRNVAEAFVERGYDASYFTGTPDDEVVAELTTITGVGVWTAKMQLMFSLGRPDVFPVEDLGIRKGMQTLYADDLTRAEMVAAAEAWRPHRSVASLYVWRAYED